MTVPPSELPMHSTDEHPPGMELAGKLGTYCLYQCFTMNVFSCITKMLKNGEKSNKCFFILTVREERIAEDLAVRFLSDKAL